MSMHKTGTLAAHESKRAHEFPIVVIALLAALLLQVRLAQATSLFARHFWLDEFYTQTLVADPSIRHAMRALAAGVETHPPALYLSLRAFTALIARTDEVALRSFAFLAAVIALLGIYRTLRLTFPAWASLAGVMAVWSHPLMQRQSFEARFYVPWLAALVWYSYFLTRCREDLRLAGRVAVAGTALYVCTVHYFGIISLALVLTAELSQRALSRQRIWPGVAASMIGPLGLVACLPMLWQQRQATTLSSWINQPDSASLVSFLKDIYAEPAIAVAATVAWLGTLFSSASAGSAAARPRLSSQAGMTSLLLLPLILVIFSYTVQPALVDRYALPAVAGLAPAVAWLFTRMSAYYPALAACLFLGLGGQQLYDQASTMRSKDRETQALISSIHAVAGSETILFESPEQQYLVCHYAPNLLPWSYLIDFEQGEIGYAPSSRIFVRDLARKYSEFYGPPSIMKWSKFRANYKHAFMVPLFLLIYDPKAMLDKPYPGFYVHKVNERIYELIAKDKK
jgi:hypothetical protein